jgi:N-acetylglutamate synthase-like GNAT family acetyltransferase
MMMRLCDKQEFEAIYTVINDGALAYKEVIPEDCWAEPYMSREELQCEMDAGVAFWGLEENGMLCAVMGLQAVEDVTLIRHAYVLTASQRRGIGAQLLCHLMSLTKTPVLIGTWADALWAIRFYEKNGFRIVDGEQKDRLLKRYWTVSQRQMQVSVVLADAAWRERNGG